MNPTRKGPVLRFLGIMLLALLGGCFVEPAGPDGFYEADEAALPAGEPGEILRAETFPGAPEGARAWRVLYRSTGLSGEPIAVSGIIVAPEGGHGGPRPVVAWAHPTTGVARRCAPSLSEGAFGRIPGLKALLDHGYVVAATDYPGLGAGGPHPYLVGVAEGRAVIDSVRAAGRLDQARASPSFAVWGHSQGGHAALFAGQLARSYAPELKLAGVAAAAPATDLATLLRADLKEKAGKVLTAYSLWSWHRVYGAPLAPLLDASAVSAMDKIAEDCLEGPLQALVVARREKGIDRDFVHGDITATEPWASLLAENTPAPGAVPAPLFIAQGAADPLVLPAVTRAYVAAACRKGTPVRFDLRNGLDHLKIATDSAAAAVAWISERFSGTAAPSDCGGLPELPAKPG